MSSMPAAAPGPPPDPAVAPATPLDELVATLDQIGRLTARAVQLAGDAAAADAAEQREGLPLELFVGLRCRLTHTDRRMLVGAAEVLQHLPVTRVLFGDGQLSWSQVRAIVSAARRLTVDQRALLDDRIAATIDRYGGVDAFDPDGLVDAVCDAVNDIKDTAARQRERRQEHRNFIAVQQRLDGGVKFHGEADPLKGAAILNALDTKAGQPTAAGEPTPPGEPTTRAHQRLDALAGICADWLGGDTPPPPRALKSEPVRRRGLEGGRVSAPEPDWRAFHHTIEQANGGLHHPDQLVALARRNHRITHKHGWNTTLDPTTAQVTITRHNRTWKSLPRGTPLARPPNPHDNRAPPGLPF